MTALFKSVSGSLPTSGAVARRSTRKFVGSLALAGLWGRAIRFVMMLAQTDEEARMKGATAYSTYFAVSTSVLH